MTRIHRAAGVANAGAKLVHFLHSRAMVQTTAESALGVHQALEQSSRGTMIPGVALGPLALKQSETRIFFNVHRLTLGSRSLCMLWVCCRFLADCNHCSMCHKCIACPCRGLPARVTVKDLTITRDQSRVSDQLPRHEDDESPIAARCGRR